MNDLFQDHIGSDGRSFFLWVDVEGAAERVLTGALQVLRRTLALFVECENFRFWRDGSTPGGIASLLFQAGFVPVARDREYGDHQFNVLFVAGRVAHLLVPTLFDASSPVRACLLRGGAAPVSAPKSPSTRPFFSSVASYLKPRSRSSCLASTTLHTPRAWCPSSARWVSATSCYWMEALHILRCASSSPLPETAFRWCHCRAIRGQGIF